MKNKKVVLIIDDDKNLVQILTDKLTRENFTPLLAFNGEEGLTIAIEQKPDCILLDIKMPKMDGSEFLKKLRKDPWGGKAFVLILSNIDSPSVVSNALKDMARDYLIKSDWSLDDIIKKVKEELV